MPSRWDLNTFRHGAIASRNGIIVFRHGIIASRNGILAFRHGAIASSRNAAPLYFAATRRHCIQPQRGDRM